MDSCNWDESRFNEIKDEFVKMLQMIGYKPKKIPFIPYSGFNGDNLVQKSDKAPWYKGWTANRGPKQKITGFTLLDALENYIVPPTRFPDKPLRLPVSNVYNIKGVGQIIAGTIEQGTPLVCPSRASPRMRRSPPETSSTRSPKAPASPSASSVPWLLSRSTPVFSSPATALLSFPVPPRLRAR